MLSIPNQVSSKLSRSPHEADDHPGACQRVAAYHPAFLLFGSCHGERTAAAHVVPGGLDPAVGALEVRDTDLVNMAAKGSAMPLTRAQAFVIWIARSPTGTRSGCAPWGRSPDRLLRPKASRRYPIRKVTPCGSRGLGAWRTPDEGRHLALWTQEAERIGVPMAAVQDEAKHAVRAMSPLKSCEVEKPQPKR
jgi:hypothetical protein